MVLFSGTVNELIATEFYLDSTGSFVTLGVSYGPLLLAFIGYSYLVDLLAAGLLGRLVLRARGRHRRQAMLVFLAGTLPFVTGWVSLAGLGPYPNVDLTPVSFAFTSVVVAAAIFRYSLLDISPVVRDTILRELDVGLVILDAQRRIVDINELAGEILEVDPASTIGSPGQTVFDGDPSLWDRLAEQDRVQLETDVGHFEATLVRSDRVAGPGGVAILFRDVSELMSRQAELERQNARLDEFASILAHDLRNPLNVAEGRLSLTRETGETDHLDAVERALSRMGTLINDILELARQGQQVSEREAIELGSLAQRAWENVATGDATLEIVESVSLEADPNRLTRLFENLFRNAVEHAGPDVTVRVGVTDDGFYVEDDGPGIPGDRREAVFEGGYSTGGDGVGIGLAIVREIANAHGWTIAVGEGADGGARFECDGVTFADGLQPENVSGIAG